MSLEILRKKGLFKTKQIWFADYPYDVKGVDRVIFRDCKNKADVSGFTCEKIVTLTIDLTQSLNLIWSNMEKSSCRNSINRAERDGIKIIINQKFKEFNKVNRIFRKKKGLLGESLSLDFIKKNSILFVAEFNDEVLGGQVYLTDKDNIRWLVGASKRLEGNREKSVLIGNANRLLVWEAIKYAKLKEIKEFDFGGYYIGGKKDLQKEKINFFKKSFGGELAVRYNYRKDYSKIFSFVTKIYHKLK